MNGAFLGSITQVKLRQWSRDRAFDDAPNSSAPFSGSKAAGFQS